MNTALHVVTGSFGYTGKAITQALLATGARVRTLTNTRPERDPFSGSVEVHPLVFDQPEKLAESLAGAKVLYNTYWVRFNHRRFSHRDAVINSKRLFDAAKAAKVERIVHVSITNPSLDSPFEYFRGKAELEAYLTQLGIPCTILRPAVFFGNEDILINNIAWVLRTFPIYGVFGNGAYGIQPIHVNDFAELAVTAGSHTGNVIIDAVGPESFTFRQLVADLGRIIGCPRPIVNIPPWFGLLAGSIMGIAKHDVVITREEIGGLMAGLLAVNAPPVGRTKLTDWAMTHHTTLGMRYASELSRRMTQ